MLELPSQAAVLPIASALLVAAVPIVVLSSNLLAAGVRPPTASALRGVHDGGGINPFLVLTGVLDIPGSPSKPAFARKFFAAFEDNLCEIRSLVDGTGM